MKYLSKRHNQIFAVTLIETLIFYRVATVYNIDLMYVLIMIIPLYAVFSLGLEGCK